MRQTFHHRRDETFDLTGLATAAAALLHAAGTSATDGRVADAPDGRTLRYYQSSGLIDRPLEYRGRRAIYGYKHLLQAVCVKLLQARGHSLAQVQRALTGAPLSRLEDAVADAIGAPPIPSPPPTVPDPLVSARLAPGVVVTLDPSLVADPNAVLALLARALPPPHGALT